MSAGSVDPLSLYNLSNRALAADPYPHYHLLRSLDPVHWDNVLHSWVLTRFEDVLAALHDPRLSEERITPFLERLPAESRREIAPLADSLSNMMLFTDPPDHTRLRGLVQKAFSPRIIELQRPYIENQIDILLDRVEQTGSMDIVKDFSLPLSLSVIAEMLGIPTDERAQFEEWTSLLHSFFSLSEREVSRVQALREYFGYLLVSRYRRPGSDLLSALIAARDQEDMFTEEELFSVFLLLFDAGQVTTTNLISNGMLALLQHPEQLTELGHSPRVSTIAVNELLRYDGPVQFTGRIAKENIHIGGRYIRRGQNVTLVLGAANRDPAAFPLPDKLDLQRKPNRHLAFGYGVHYCLGAALALIEAQAAIGRLLQRLPDLVLSSEALEWHDSINFRFLSSLPVLFEPRYPDHEYGQL